MLAGLMSRCTTPRSCAKPRPSATCAAISTASAVASAPCLQPRAQVRAFEQLHRQVREVALLAEVEGRDDVRMVELARGLAPPWRSASRIPCASSTSSREQDRLQRDHAVERRILGLVHHAHRAAAELAEDLVAADLRVLLLAHSEFHLLHQPAHVALALRRGGAVLGRKAVDEGILALLRDAPADAAGEQHDDGRGAERRVGPPAALQLDSIAREELVAAQARVGRRRPSARATLPARAPHRRARRERRATRAASERRRELRDARRHRDAVAHHGFADSAAENAHRAVVDARRTAAGRPPTR